MNAFEFQSGGRRTSNQFDKELDWLESWIVRCVQMRSFFSFARPKKGFRGRPVGADSVLE